jgi:hypothetical protein
MALEAKFKDVADEIFRIVGQFAFGVFWAG